MDGFSNLFAAPPSYLSGLLGEDETERLRRQAQQSGLMNLGLSLLAGAGPSPQRQGLGQLLAQGVMAGQQASRNAYEQAVRDRMMQEQIAEQRQAREERQRALTEQRMAEAALPAVIRRPATELYGEDIMGQRVGEGISYGAPSIDLGRLLSLPIGVQQRIMPQVGAAAKLIPELRKAQLIGQQAAQENPFATFTQDATIPANVKALAAQYEKSFAAGQLDPDKVDDRVKQLTEMAQRIQQFNITQAGLEETRKSAEAAKQLAAQNTAALIGIRRAAEESKPEQFSYAQKKDFDVVAESKDESKKAASNASLADRAAPLVEKAFTGVLEAGIKGLAGAVGIPTEAKEANDKLVQITNQLAVNAPKFTGPTSDRDAARYDAAVGDLANPKKDIKAKMEALKEIKALAAKTADYARQQEDYYYKNNKSLRGFEYKSNPYEGM